MSDLIRRADAIEALRGLFDMRKSRAKIIVECFTELIDALPSADRPKGEWIEDLNFAHRAWECSKCGAITSIKTPFCHECGADMRGTER